jgi:hypothetical protein
MKIRSTTDKAERLGVKKEQSLKRSKNQKDDINQKNIH